MSAKRDKAFTLLRDAFVKMKDAKYTKNAEKMQEVESLAAQLDVDRNVARQTYISTFAREENIKGPEAISEEKLARLQAQTERLLFSSDYASQYVFDPFRFDDVSMLGHLELERIREERSYLRSAAYELPLLSQFRKNYIRPSKQQVLRFEYTQKLSADKDEMQLPEVILSFKIEEVGAALSLDKPSQHKLALLAAEYLENGSVVIKSAAFPTQLENREYLLSIFSKLVAEAKTDDKFLDVPLPMPKKLKPLYPSHKWPASWNRPDLKPKQKEDIYSVACQN